MADQSEEQIRAEAARFGDLGCQCAICFLLRLLDQARAELELAGRRGAHRALEECAMANVWCSGWQPPLEAGT